MRLTQLGAAVSAVSAQTQTKKVKTKLSKTEPTKVVAEFKIGDQPYEVDFSAVEKRILDNMDQKLRPMFEQYMKQVKENPDWNSGGRGRGVVETFLPDDKKTKLLEEFHKGEKADP